MFFLSINWGNALVVTLIGFFLVVFMLFLLVFVIRFFGFLMTPKVKAVKTQPAANALPQEDDDQELRMSADETAAIATALCLYFDEEHDEESNVMTIKTMARRYSPWSSKIYGINNLHK